MQSDTSIEKVGFRSETISGFLATLKKTFYKYFFDRPIRSTHPVDKVEFFRRDARVGLLDRKKQNKSTASPTTPPRKTRDQTSRQPTTAPMLAQTIILLLLLLLPANPPGTSLSPPASSAVTSSGGSNACYRCPFCHTSC